MSSHEKLAIFMIRLAALAGVVSGCAGIIFVMLTASVEPEGYLLRLVTGVVCLALGLALYGISKLIANWSAAPPASTQTATA